MFDECMPRGVARQLRDAVGESIELDFVVDRFKAGDKDEDWLPALAEDGNWIVVTGDSGRQSGLRPKLPSICEELKITCILLSPTLQKKPALFKIAAILGLWEQMLKTAEHPPGSQFRIRMRTRRKNKSMSFVMDPVP